jgi:hypothetical protein
VCFVSKTYLLPASKTFLINSITDLCGFTKVELCWGKNNVAIKKQWLFSSNILASPVKRSEPTIKGA